jgi:hypothetical protein
MDIEHLWVYSDENGYFKASFVPRESGYYKVSIDIRPQKIPVNYIEVGKGPYKKNAINFLRPKGSTYYVAPAPSPTPIPTPSKTIPTFEIITAIATMLAAGFLMRKGK